MQQRNRPGNNRNARILALIGFTTLTGTMTYAQTLHPAQPKQQVYKVKADAKAFTSVEQMPQPSIDVNKYLAEHLRYPQEAVRQGIQGRVVLQFVVEADGNIANVVTVRDIGGGCGQEAERVVKSMPRWTPGKQDGKPVRVYYTLPVSFKMMDAGKAKGSGSATTAQKPQEGGIKPGEKTFTSVEQMPQPPMDLNKYLAEHLRYPQEAVKQGIQGRVVLQFVVAADGNITNVVTVRDIGGGCGQEAERVVKSMPRWTPGKQDGKPVRVYYTLPVSFRLADSGKPTGHPDPNGEPTAPNK